MDKIQTDSKSKILNKLLIPTTYTHTNYTTNNSNNTNRPSKSHSLYNVKDFLPTEEAANPNLLSKRM